jgi:hypothetical protein
MAMFFETVELDPNSTTADIGREPQYRGQPLQMAHLVRRLPRRVRPGPSYLIM